MGRDAKSVALAMKKVEYVTALVKAEPDLKMNAVVAKVKDKFGSRLYQAKLRDAFVGAGGKVGKRKHRKVAAKVRGSAARTAGRKSGRGRKGGRRKADKAIGKTARGLGAMETHLVVVSTEGKPLVRTCSSQKDATDFIALQLIAGTPLTNIACYLRQPLSVNFDV